MSDNHAQQALMGQLEINKAEAASGSLFQRRMASIHRLGMRCAFATILYFTAAYSVWRNAAGVDILSYQSLIWVV